MADVAFARGAQATAPVAPFLDRSAGILALGGGLILVNFLTSDGSPLWKAITSGTAPTIQSTANAPTALKGLALQSLMLGILYVLAKLDEDAGSFGLTFVLALWGLWLYNFYLHRTEPSGTKAKG